MSLPRLFLTILPVYSPSGDARSDGVFHFEKLTMEDTEGILSFLDQQLKLVDDKENLIEEVADKIANFKKLNTLELRGNTLGVKAGEKLAEAIKKHPELKRCNWSDMFTGRLKTEIPPILKSLFKAVIFANCQIVELDLSDNAFGPIGAEGISEFLVSKSAFGLQTLKLNNNGLGAGGKVVASCLIKCHENAIANNQKFTLKRFIAGRNRLEDPGAIALAAAFSTIQTLEEIRLPQNGIRPSGISALATAFEDNPNLKIIDINDNTCTRVGALDIAEVLPSLKHLVELDLGDCLCRDEGVLSIVAGLDGANGTLKKLNLSGNEITPLVIDDLLVYFTSDELSNVKVNIAFNNLGQDFSAFKNDYEGEENIDFGESDDDQGTLSDLSDEEPEQGAENESMEDEYDANTSRETVINTSIQRDVTDDILNDLVTNGFGCLRIPKDSNDGLLSFLDRKLKLDTAKDAEPVAQEIENTGVVRALEFRGNTVGVEAGERLAKALEKHPELERCLWSDMFTSRLKNEIPPILIGFGRAMIKAKCQITELDLSDNAFGPIGAEGIKELLESPTSFTLETLKLNNNGLGIGGKQIASSLQECLNRSVAAGGENRLRLKTFIAGRNRLENPGAQALAAVFKQLETLETIQMPQNGINKEGIEAIAESLKYNRNLRVLNLNDNTTTQLGAYAISKNLQHLPLLEVLDLGDCLCRDAGCHAIIDSLNPAIHRNLKEVNLSGAELSPQAAQIIIKKWRKFSEKKAVLKIGANNFGELFKNVRNAAKDNTNIDIGESEDDCGSLSSDEDDEERNSGVSSDGDEEDEGMDSEHGRLNSSDERRFDEMIEQYKEQIDQMQNHYESRVQEESARVLLQLLIPIEKSDSNPIVFDKAATVAEEVVRRVAAVKRNPIPTTTQLINHCVAQVKTLGIKPEEDWGFNVNKQILGKMLRELLLRGHFELERELILHFFPSDVN